jgi:hypothetical protein
LVNAADCVVKDCLNLTCVHKAFMEQSLDRRALVLTSCATVSFSTAVCFGFDGWI